jgi:branched-chain amino acid transport system permease protein
MFLGTAGYVSAHAARSVGRRRSSRSCRHARRDAARACVSGALAIRRQGIYFAMITLAIAQLVFFFCLQAPFTGGEDGIQSVAARAHVRRARPRRT